MRAGLGVARPYFAVLAARFSLTLQYRAAAFAGFMTQCWWGVIKILVLAAFYTEAAHQPITLAQAVTYVWLGQAFLVLLPWQADAEIAQAVETGNVGYERLRPVDTYFFWFMRAAAWRMAGTTLRAFPMFLLAGVAAPLVGLAAWRWRLPPDPGAALAFVLSMALVVMLSAALTVLLNVLAVSFRSGRAAGLPAGLVNLLSGMVVPLVLLPGWMQPFLFWQPFAGLVDIPYRIYFGNLAGAAAVVGLAQQALWIVVFVAMGRAALAAAMQRVDMQGS